MNKQRRPKRRIFQKTITILTISGYLLAIGGWYFSPLTWWPLGLASIGFAYLWSALLVLAGWWWLKGYRSISALCIVLMVAGFQPAMATFSIGWDKEYEALKEPSSLRVMQWNSKDLPGNHKGWVVYKDERKAVENFVVQFKPDLICIQDFAEHIGKKKESNYSFFKDTLGYPYKIFAPSTHMFHVFGRTISGTAIFSRRPFIRSGIIPYKNREMPGNIVWADVLLNGRPMRIVTTHFKSMNLFSYKAFQNSKMPYYLKPDSSIIMSKNIFLKITYFQAEHYLQAKELKAFMDTCSIPVILSSDLNTVPASATYRVAKGNLNDGFIGSKTGLGNTFNYLLPNLRIDYLLHHPTLETKQWKHFTKGFFDHDHLMADYAWKKQ